MSFGADLPAFTKIIVGASRFMVSNWYIVFGAVFAAIFAFMPGGEPDEADPVGELTDSALEA